MKKFSVKLVIFIAFLILSGFASSNLWINAIAGIGALVMIVFLHLDNLDFCKKMDRIMAGEKNVEL